jgi:putative oxidoreductase
VGISFFLVHGLPKIIGGPARWEKLGGAMGNIGVGFAPSFWGFMASASEFGGGLLILLGLFTRSASAFMAFTMFVAMMTHLSRMDPWGTVFHPIELLTVFIALLFIGPGKYSLDGLIAKSKKQN